LSDDLKITFNYYLIINLNLTVMKKLVLLLSVIFALGLFLKPAPVQAQDASEKDYNVQFVMSHVQGWMWLMDWTQVRHFTTKSGKEQYKMEGWWGWFYYELVINVNATGEEGATEGTNCVADGTVYWWGMPILCGHNQQWANTNEIFGFWGPMMFINMDWEPCMIY
jgi:hypothetical protein